MVGTRCRSYPSVCPVFQEKNFCQTSALFPERHTGIKLPIRRTAVEHYHHPGFQTRQNAFRGKARLGKLLSAFNSVLKSKLARTMWFLRSSEQRGMKKKDRKGRRSLQFPAPSLTLGLYCCSALRTQPLMVVCDTPVILFLMLFFLPPPPRPLSPRVKSTV